MSAFAELFTGGTWQVNDSYLEDAPLPAAVLSVCGVARPRDGEAQSIAGLRAAEVAMVRRMARDHYDRGRRARMPHSGAQR